MSYDLFEVPDGITPLVGFRGWRCIDDRLWSCYRDVEWQIGSPMNSECIHPTTYVPNERTKSKGYRHGAPTKTCTCGIYALSDWPAGNIKKVQPWPSTAVTGMILGWGHIVMGTKGFRAQYARPIALITRPRSIKLTKTIDKLAEAYGIEKVDLKEIQNGHWKDSQGNHH